MNANSETAVAIDLSPAETDPEPCVTSLNEVFKAALERLHSMGIVSSTLELVAQQVEEEGENASST